MGSHGPYALNMAADGRAEFDPKEIARADFPTAFRGYDQEEVRRYLTRLAAAVGRAQQLGILGSVDHDEGSAHLRAAEAEREAAELRARVAELEALVESSFDASAAAVPDADSPAARDHVDHLVDEQAPPPETERASGGPDAAIDEAELIEQLGHETAKILEAARSAAADITKRATSEAAQTERAAAEDARRVRDEAENALAAARVEAKRIMTAATDEAAQIQERLEVEAQRAYDDARDEADRIVTDAAAKVEHDLAAARLRADQLVADAEGAREEVLGDLVRRRRVHRSQLSRLTEARDRLARSLAAARSELDEVATTIDVAAGNSTIDLTEPETSSEALESDALDGEAVADLIAKLDRARADTQGPAETRNGVHAAVAANGTVDDDTMQLRSGDDASGRGVEIGSGVLVVDAGDEGTDPEHCADPEAAVAGDLDTDRDLDLDRELGVDAEPDSMADPDAETDTGVDTDVDSALDSVAVDDLDLAEFGASPSDYRAQAAQAIDELNGPIDGDRLLDQLGFTDERVLGSDDGTLTRSESRGDLPRNTPAAGRPPELFEQRDIAMTKATPGFRRRLKRAVNDDQRRRARPASGRRQAHQRRRAPRARRTAHRLHCRAHPGPARRGHGRCQAARERRRPPPRGRQSLPAARQAHRRQPPARNHRRDRGVAGQRPGGHPRSDPGDLPRLSELAAARPHRRRAPRGVRPRHLPRDRTGRRGVVGRRSPARRRPDLRGQQRVASAPEGHGVPQRAHPPAVDARLPLLGRTRRLTARLDPLSGPRNRARADQNCGAPAGSLVREPERSE